MNSHLVAYEALERWAEAVLSAVVELDALTDEFSDYVPTGRLIETLEKTREEILGYLAGGGR